MHLIYDSERISVQPKLKMSVLQATASVAEKLSKEIDVNGDSSEHKKMPDNDNVNSFKENNIVINSESTKADLVANVNGSKTDLDEEDSIEEETKTLEAEICADEAKFYADKNESNKYEDIEKTCNDKVGYKNKIDHEDKLVDKNLGVDGADPSEALEAEIDSPKDNCDSEEEEEQMEHLELSDNEIQCDEEENVDLQLDINDEQDLLTSTESKTQIESEEVTFPSAEILNKHNALNCNEKPVEPTDTRIQESVKSNESKLTDTSLVTDELLKIDSTTECDSGNPNENGDKCKDIVSEESSNNVMRGSVEEISGSVILKECLEDSTNSLVVKEDPRISDGLINETKNADTKLICETNKYVTSDNEPVSDAKNDLKERLSSNDNSDKELNNCKNSKSTNITYPNEDTVNKSEADVFDIVQVGISEIKPTNNVTTNSENGNSHSKKELKEPCEDNSAKESPCEDTCKSSDCTDITDLNDDTFNETEKPLLGADVVDINQDGISEIQPDVKTTAHSEIKNSKSVDDSKMVVETDDIISMVKTGNDTVALNISAENIPTQHSAASTHNDKCKTAVTLDDKEKSGNDENSCADFDSNKKSEPNKSDELFDDLLNATGAKATDGKLTQNLAHDTNNKSVVVNDKPIDDSTDSLANKSEDEKSTSGRKTNLVTKPSEESKDCVMVDDDDDTDDIMVIDEEINSKTHSNDASGDQAFKGTLESLQSEKPCAKSSEDVISTDVTEKDTPTNVDQNQDVKPPNAQSAGDNESVNSVNEKPLVQLNFLDAFKSKMGEMTKGDLEEFCILKIVEGVVDRSNLSDIKAKLKTMMQNVEEWRKKAMVLSKQNRDLQIVLRAVQEAQKKRSDEIITPLKITRSVGMQVLMTENKADPSFNRGRGLKRPGVNPNNATTPKAAQGKATPQKKNTTPIPVPRLVPAQNSSPTKATTARPTPQVQNSTVTSNNSGKAASTVNGVRPNVQNKAADKRPYSVSIDLTDDEPPPAKQMATSKGIQPPVRLVPSQQLMATGHRTPLLNQKQGASNPRQVYIPIGGPQGNIRPGQTVLFKSNQTNVRSRQPYPGAAVRGGGGGGVRAPPPRSNQKHPAPLPQALQQPQPPNWKALPPAPDLKISKIENGIVVSWKIDGYQEESFEEIVSYQLYAYQETSAPANTFLWNKIGDIKALPLPMACTLTQFIAGYKYYFAVRAVDIRSRIGPFSLPGSILLLNK